MYDIPRRFRHYHVSHAYRPEEPGTDLLIDIPHGRIEVNLCAHPTANVTRVRFPGEEPKKAKPGVIHWMRRAG